MSGKYILGLDQSTQGTKLLLFDEVGRIVTRVDRAHRQIVSDRGWVSHDMEEVYGNVIALVKELLEKQGIGGADIAALGISNQRETTVAWDDSGKPYAPAIVWQCGRAAEIVERTKGLWLDENHCVCEPDGQNREAAADDIRGTDGQNREAAADYIRRTTGIPLSAFYPAAKMRWLLENDCKGIPAEQLHMGTVDSYLLYRLTGGEVFATDASNASRTQLMDLESVSWSREVCGIFGIPVEVLPEIRDSNALFGETDFEGLLDCKIPIRCMMGDSHGALYGQHCHKAGMMKTTYGTGSSMMLNTGTQCVESGHGLAASLAWKIDGAASYVLEGNINYTGAVISWLKNDLGLIASAGEANGLCEEANPEDTTVVVPAFSGLSAPYWEDNVRAAIVGMSRTTRKAELVRAAVESIAQQITDVYEAMKLDFGSEIEVLRADGGPTNNPYLMQFQSDMTGARVFASKAEELSAIGVAYLAGIGAGVFDREKVFGNITYQEYGSSMDDGKKAAKRAAWKEAVWHVLPQRK